MLHSFEIINIIFKNSVFITILKAFLIIGVTAVALVLGCKLIQKYFRSSLHRRKNANKIKTLERIAVNIYKTVVLFVAVAIFLDSILKVDTSSILTVAGVSGLAVGFASQTIIKDFLAGVMLLMEDTIIIGDVVEMNGYKGTVEDISFRSICLRGEDDVLHVIPNNIIRNFSNHSRKTNKDEDTNKQD